MSETRERAFTLELTDEDIIAFIERCYWDGTTPAEVLEGFINDLIGGEASRGSDERLLASDYYDRCGYGSSFCGTFAQWLFNRYGGGTVSSVAVALNDIETLREEIAELKKNPDEAREEEIKKLEAEIAEDKEFIEEFYREYKESTTEPKALEEGLDRLLDYHKVIKQIRKGGAI